MKFQIYFLRWEDEILLWRGLEVLLYCQFDFLYTTNLACQLMSGLKAIKGER